ncbi:MAG: GatB/YqeY domain-containing protein, partial [Chitinophagaceae bacterium]
MSLELRINEEIKTAMKAKDEAGLRTLRAIKAAILIEKTSGAAKEMTEADELKMLQKMAKQRRDSLEIFKTQ